MNATVCIPWRDGPGRLPIFNRCTQFWKDNNFPVIAADSDPNKPFLCAQARNNAIRRAQTPVVIIADADTIPDDIEQIHTAIPYAQQGAIVWPYTIDRSIPADWAESIQPLSQAPVLLEKPIREPGLPPIDVWTTALIVISRATFWSIGAFDERFTPGVGGWDDVSFVMCAATLLKVVHVEGLAWSFRLPGVSFDYGQNNPNIPRCALYSTANRAGEEAMLTLLRTRPECRQLSKTIRQYQSESV